MSRCVSEIGSVTYASKARKALSDESIGSSIVKLSDSRRGRGCIYGIEVNCNQTENAVRVLQKNGIRYESFETKG